MRIRKLLVGAAAGRAAIHETNGFDCYQKPASDLFTMNILQVNTADIGGGAEKIGWDLFKAYHGLGHNSWLAVGQKKSAESNVLQIPNVVSRSCWYRLWQNVHAKLCGLNLKLRGFGIWRLSRFAATVADPSKSANEFMGWENFNYPGTIQLLKLTGKKPDILHCHNLHGNYFDLRMLPWLSRQLPIILTLHDAWLLSGHCAHSFECERWRTGCGHCPDLSIYPAVHRDATAYNWSRKCKIYANSRLRVATPSQWLMEKVTRSMLMPRIVEHRVIPNGVDLSVFKPVDKTVVRAELGIPVDSKVLLFTANGIRENVWKDYQLLRKVIALVAASSRAKILFLALGEQAPSEYFCHLELRFIPYQKDAVSVARYYQAADVYIHAAKVDTFPNVVIEALACGTPVVATAVGGIPEQIKPLQHSVSSVPVVKRMFNATEATGILVAPGDANCMAESVDRLLRDDQLRLQLGQNAVKDARARFSLNIQAKAYLDWYNEILQEACLHAA